MRGRNSNFTWNFCGYYPGASTKSHQTNLVFVKLTRLDLVKVDPIHERRLSFPRKPPPPKPLVLIKPYPHHYHRNLLVIGEN